MHTQFNHIYRNQVSQSDSLIIEQVKNSFEGLHKKKDISYQTSYINST